MRVDDEKYTYPIVKETDGLIVIRIDTLDFDNKSSCRFLNCYHAFDDFSEWISNLGGKVIRTDSSIVYLCLSKNGTKKKMERSLEKIIPELKRMHRKEYANIIYC